MSTSVETRPAKAPKFAAVIDENIGLVQRKIRLGDLSRGLLALTALTFGYVLVAATFDLAIRSDSSLVTILRCILFGIFAIAFLGLAGWTAVRYLTHVNPYFAARRLEETIPDSKNSLINWLDLRDQDIPPAIYQAVGLRAARDVQSADPEQVVSTKEISRLGIAIGVFAVGLGILFLVVPHQFGSLLAHAFAPLQSGPTFPPVTITLVKPADGDAVVPANQRVDILAIIEGRLAEAGSPDAPTLHYRNDPSDLHQRLPLEEDKDGRWSVRLTPEQIRSGLWYKLTAGNASTPEHRLTVRTQPFVSEFAVTYRYRDYRKTRPETVVFPNAESHQPRILGYRGTEVLLTIKANAPIAKGTLEFESAGKRTPIKSEPRSGDPKTLAFRWTLDKSGMIRVHFESPAGEKNLDREPYEVHVLEDGAPLVELVEPGKDIAAPANGSLLLAGIAFDEFGVTGLSLQVRVPGKKELYTQPYKPGKSWKFDDGSYPKSIEYFDVLRLEKLNLPSGTELEYWLEATDNCDYPKANVGRSATYKLKLITPDDPADQKSKREKAETQALGSQSKQDDKHGQENNTQNKNKDGDGPGAGDNGSSPQEQARKDELQKKMEKTGSEVAKALDKNGDNKSQEPNPGSGDPKANDTKPDQQPNNKGSDTNPNGAKSPSDPKSGEPKGKENPKDGSSGSDSNPSKSPKDGKPKDGASKDDGNPSANPKEGSGDGKEKDATKPDGKQEGKQKGSGPEENTSETAGQSGSQPDKTPGGKDDKSKGEGGDEGGTRKETSKKEGAPKFDGKVSPDAKGEASDTKPDKSKPAKEAGTGKSDDKGNPTKNDMAKGPKTDPKGNGKMSEPTKEEIEKLKDLLEKDAPEADKLAKDLAQRGKDMQNQDNKKALQDALQKAGRQDDVNTMNREEKLPAPTPMSADGSPMPKDSGEKMPAPGPSAGGKEPDDKKGTDAAANTGGGFGYDEKLKAMTADEAFRRKLGSLQIDNIEDLKKRVDKKVLEQAGVSEAEWQQFLKNAQEYQRYLDRHRPAARKDAKTLQGGASKIAAQGTRVIESSPNPVQSPLEGAAASPPPEFQDAQRAFTRGGGR